MIKSERPDNNNMSRYLQTEIANKQLGRIIFVLPSLCGRNDYTVKALCNFKTGTIAQCIKSSTIHPIIHENNRNRRG